MEETLQKRKEKDRSRNPEEKEWERISNCNKLPKRGSYAERLRYGGGARGGVVRGGRGEKV